MGSSTSDLQEPRDLERCLGFTCDFCVGHSHNLLAFSGSA
jgi:hypothetical protein